MGFKTGGIYEKTLTLNPPLQGLPFSLISLLPLRFKGGIRSASTADGQTWCEVNSIRFPLSFTTHHCYKRK